MTESGDLHRMSAKELGQLFPIIICDHSDTWVGLFETEKELILNSLDQQDVLRIDHIGSTAIPGLQAKPTIDILLQVTGKTDTQTLKDAFKSLDYELNYRPKMPPPHLIFVKGYTDQGFCGQAYHVHVRYDGDWDEIRFRDYLIAHEDLAKEYGELKLELAKRYRNDREAYTDSKTDFIERINKLTRSGS